MKIWSEQTQEVIVMSYDPVSLWEDSPKENHSHHGPTNRSYSRQGDLKYNRGRLVKRRDDAQMSRTLSVGNYVYIFMSVSDLLSIMETASQAKQYVFQVSALTSGKIIYVFQISALNQLGRH